MYIIAIIKAARASLNALRADNDVKKHSRARKMREKTALIRWAHSAIVAWPGSGPRTRYPPTCVNLLRGCETANMGNFVHQMSGGF